MGLGDELMAGGAAEIAGRKAGGAKVHILDRHGKPRWHDLWFGSPIIAAPNDTDVKLRMVDGPGVRPYIHAVTEERFVWLPYHPVRYRLPMIRIDMGADQLVREGRWPSCDPYVLIEPNIKARASVNKQWPLDRWREFVRLARAAGISLVQAVPSARSPVLPGVTGVLTQTVWQALSVLEGALAYVGHEGFFHHASAALVMPAVVIYGGYISPEITGYADQRSLFTGGEPCGSRLPCEHCRVAMEAITPADVLAQLKELI